MLVSADVSGQAALVPNYGGVDSGEAGSTGGRDQAREARIESGLPNGVRVDGLPFDADRQLPHRPAGRIDSSTTASATGDADGQPAGGDLLRGETGTGANATPERSATSRVLREHSDGHQPQAVHHQQLGGQQQPQAVHHQQLGGQQQPQAVHHQQLGGQQQPQAVHHQQLGGQQQPQAVLPQQLGGQQQPQVAQPQPSTHVSQRVIVEPEAMPSQESSQATAQFNERSALVAAVHQRASRTLQSTVDGSTAAVSMNEGAYGEYGGEQMVWYSRLGSFFQRTVGPMVDKLRAPAAPTPPSRRSSSPLRPLTNPSTDPPLPGLPHAQGMQEWGRGTTGALRLERQGGDQSSTDSVPAEVVQDEVRRQVQLAMQTRDNRNQALQAENLELKQLLMEMLENTALQQGARGGEAPPAVAGGPDRSLEVGAGPVAGRTQPSGQGELLRGERDRDLPSLPVLSRGGVSAPPGLERRDERLEGDDNPPPLRPGGGGGAKATGKPPGNGGPASDSWGDGPLGGGGGPGGHLGSVGATGHGDADPMGLLAKGIQQLQQLHLRRDGPEQELLKGSLELPKLPEPYQDVSSVAFLEWVYETGQVVGSITDKASVWWTVTLEAVMEAYHRYQIDGDSIEALGGEARTNARPGCGALGPTGQEGPGTFDAHHDGDDQTGDPDAPVGLGQGGAL